MLFLSCLTGFVCFVAPSFVQARECLRFLLAEFLFCLREEYILRMDCTNILLENEFFAFLTLKVQVSVIAERSVKRMKDWGSKAFIRS